MRRSGCTPMDLPSSASSGSTSVAVASSEVNSVMAPLKTHATGAMASAGAPRRKPSPSERMSVRPLALKPSAMAKPAPRRRMMFHCSLRHLPQSMSFSPSFLPLGIMNSSVAIMICIASQFHPQLRRGRVIPTQEYHLSGSSSSIGQSNPQKRLEPSSLQKP
ncbi:Os09g0485050 [Oryza sativa Japonica Group]|uniref:Os09g0485050 protein n=1 Tax=Oryza sativa subsp. japonica TaxID=39947 RepID=A0A0P0XPU6_ORYSJ|nr:hypothetical protein EE612_048612 [Oryza sativa]BAT08693.1 Os09g0485050 [Oryza sativa Japonica Group]